jgi:hypothetical protein
VAASFFPCPSCERHVKRGDGACPFCGGAIASAPPLPARPAARLARSALFAATAIGAAVAGTACGGTSEPVYGAPVPPVDAASDGPADASFQALYGAMPAPDSSLVQPDATGVPIYGAAPPPGRG